MGREPVRQTNITIHFKQGELSVTQGTPAELGLTADLSGGQFAITASHIRLCVWIVGQVDEAKRRIVVQSVKDWLWSLKHPARTNAAVTVTARVTPAASRPDPVPQTASGSEAPASPPQPVDPAAHNVNV